MTTTNKDTNWHTPQPQQSAGITDEQVKQWLHDQRNAAGIPSLVLFITTEYPADPFSAKLAGSSLYYGYGSTLQKAIDRLREQLPDARARAKKMRDEAKQKLEEAKLIEEAAAGVSLDSKEAA